MNPVRTSQRVVAEAENTNKDLRRAKAGIFPKLNQTHKQSGCEVSPLRRSHPAERSRAVTAPARAEARRGGSL